MFYMPIFVKFKMAWIRIGRDKYFYKNNSFKYAYFDLQTLQRDTDLKI